MNEVNAGLLHSMEFKTWGSPYIVSIRIPCSVLLHNAVLPDS